MIFTKQDIRLIGGRVFSYQLSLWIKQGYIIKIKNGLYVFEDKSNNIEPEELSQKIYSPSYISLEKALSIYGIIPETVYGITCITAKTTREFNNYLGNYQYKHIKKNLFFGYEEVKGKNIPYLIASPEKAILDFLYFNLTKIKTAKDMESFRFNKENIANLISKSKLNDYLAFFENDKMGIAVKLLLKC